MPYKVSDAREQVLEHLDDESGDRYARETGSNTTNYRKIDRALKVAVSTCVDDYCARGGDRFNENLAVSTTATAGKADLSTYKTAHVRSVRVSSNSVLYRIEEGDVGAGGRPDLTVRALELQIVRRFEMASAPDEDDLLMGITGTVARSWDAFDEWVCARASDALGAKDNERRDGLLRILARCEKAVFQHKRTPAAHPWPERNVSELYLSGRLRWLWFPHEQELQLVFGTR